MPRVAKTQVVFWNAGRATIRGEDIVKSDPLRLLFGKEAQILRVRIPRVTRKTLDFRAENTFDPGNEVQFSFDYIDSGDGAVIEVIHTSEERHPQVLGTIRGIPKGIRNLGRIPTRPQAPWFIEMIVLGAPYSWAMFGLAVVAFGFLRGVWPAVPAGVFLIITGLFGAWTDLRRFPRALAIRDLME